jgi:uncharacterized integral membrane protein
MFLITFAIRNDQEVHLTYYFIENLPAIPLSILLLVCFFTGVIVGSLMDVVQRLSLRREMTRLKKANKELEEKVRATAQAGEEDTQQQF